MRKTREVLRLYFDLKLGQRQIARSAQISQSTVHEYLKRFAAAELRWPLPAEMSEAELETVLFSYTAKTVSSTVLIRCQILLISTRSCSVSLAHHPATASGRIPGRAPGWHYSRFCRLYQRWKRERDVVLRQEQHGTPSRTLTL